MKKLFLLIAAALLVAGSVMPVMAADDELSVTFYTNMRMDTFWVNKNADFVRAFDVATATTSDSDLGWNFDAATSRFGALFKKGDISANVEIRPNSASYFRQWWGSWNFGPGSLLVGFTWDPAWTSIVGCCLDGGFFGSYGQPGSRLRQPQIALWFPVGTGTLKVAALQPYVPATAAQQIVPGATSRDTVIPTLSFGIDQKMGPFYIKAFGNYNKYREENLTLNKDYSVDNWHVGIQPTYALGPFTFKAIAWIAENGKGYMVGDRNPYDPLYNVAGESIEDVDSYGLGFTAVFRLSDAISFEAGYNMQQDKRKFDRRKNDRYAWYINMPWQVAKGVSLTPEFGVANDGDDEVAGVKTKQGKRTAFGVYWMISF